MENNEQKPKKDKIPAPPKRPFNFYWIYGVIVVMILGMGLFNFNSNLVRIDISDYDRYLDQGDVQGIVVNGDAVLVTIKIVVLAAFTLGVAVGVLGMVPHWWRHRSAARHQQAQVPAAAADTAAPLPAAAHGV